MGVVPHGETKASDCLLELEVLSTSEEELGTKLVIYFSQAWEQNCLCRKLIRI